MNRLLKNNHLLEELQERNEKIISLQDDLNSTYKRVEYDKEELKFAKERIKDLEDEVERMIGYINNILERLSDLEEPHLINNVDVDG